MTENKQPEGEEKSSPQSEDDMHFAFQDAPPYKKEKSKEEILDEARERSLWNALYYLDAMQAYADQEVKKANEESAKIVEKERKAGYAIGLSEGRAWPVALQSLQAYNGKLVEAVKALIICFVPIPRLRTEYEQEVVTRAEQALSSFTDKEIKTSGGGWNDEELIDFADEYYKENESVYPMMSDEAKQKWLSSYKKTSGK